MGDSWEDWDDDNAVPAIPTGPASTSEAINAKFAGEDEEEEAPKWQANIPKPQAAKAKKPSKYDESRGVSKSVDEGPLDDPLAEKLRLQKIVEQSDYQNAMELFGTGGEIDLENFKPKSAKDFEEYATALVAKYLIPHSKSSHYKTCLKVLFKKAVGPLTAQETKDVETSVAGARSDKLKEEKAAAAAANKKGSKKTNLNVGKSGGSAGLDDYKYDDLGVDDDYDFM